MNPQETGFALFRVPVHRHEEFHPLGEYIHAEWNSVVNQGLTLHQSIQLARMCNKKRLPEIGASECDNGLFSWALPITKIRNRTGEADYLVIDVRVQLSSVLYGQPVTDLNPPSDITIVSDRLNIEEAGKVCLRLRAEMLALSYQPRFWFFVGPMTWAEYSPKLIYRQFQGSSSSWRRQQKAAHQSDPDASGPTADWSNGIL